MTFKYKNTYINDVATVAGPYEAKGPINKYFDKTIDDFYIKEKTWEEAESRLIDLAIQIIKKKTNIKEFDLFISGDLLNQIVASNLEAKRLKIPFLGIYNACATSVEGLIIGSTFLESGLIKNCICSASSHNNAAEKQFRYPVEYGGIKPKTATFTTTGAGVAYLSREKKGIKIESATIGRVIDNGVSDVYDMGSVMAPACADTIYRHLVDLKRDVNYYDLILSGDLGIYGKDVLKEYIEKEYKIKLNNYDDTACIIYDIKNQDVNAGGSGPACAPLVTYSYVFKLMKEKKLKRVLLVATGALHSPATVNEKETIPGIAHAISLEVL